MAMFNFDQIYLVYLLVGASAAMFAEGAYLVFHGQASYRKNINRRLRLMDQKPDRENVLIQLRRESSMARDHAALGACSLRRCDGESKALQAFHS